MAPPKSVCSVYAETLKLWAQLIDTIHNIRSVLSKAIKAKNALLYGIQLTADAVMAEVISSASAVAATITANVLPNVSSAISTAIEAILAPLMRILLSGPMVIFALVNIPLNEAIDAGKREQLHLAKARQNLDLIIAIISKWISRFSGHKYAQQMVDALKYIIPAIEKCSRIIAQLDVSDEDGLDRSAYFDQNVYNSMRNDILSAIDITMPASTLINSRLFDARIKTKTEVESKKRIASIEEKYKNDKVRAVKYFNEERMKNKDSKIKIAIAVAEYSAQIKALDSQKKIDIEVAKLKASTKAVTDKDAYTGIINDIGEEFRKDMDILLDALQSFLVNIRYAYEDNRYCQLSTQSVYGISALINKLIKQIIALIGAAGNSAGEVVERSIRMARSLLETTRDMFMKSLERYNSTEESISATGLSANVAAGNQILMTADSMLSATVTQSIIDLVNADEAMKEEEAKLAILMKKISEIRDWDGKPGVWGVNILKSASPPYIQLLASTTGMLSTIIAVGMVPSSLSQTTIRKSIADNTRLFRKAYLHNADVMSALLSHTQVPSMEVDGLATTLKTMGAMQNFIISFDLGTTIAAIAGVDIGLDKFSGTDIPTIQNCRIEYGDMFPKSTTAAEVVNKSMLRPGHFNNEMSAYLEAIDLKFEQAVIDAQVDIILDESMLNNERSS